MEVCTLLPEGFSVVGWGDLMDFKRWLDLVRLLKMGNSVTLIGGIAILG